MAPSLVLHGGHPWQSESGTTFASREPCHGRIEASAGSCRTIAQRSRPGPDLHSSLDHGRPQERSGCCWLAAFFLPSFLPSFCGSSLIVVMLWKPQPKQGQHLPRPDPGILPPRESLLRASDIIQHLSRHYMQYKTHSHKMRSTKTRTCPTLPTLSHHST